MVHFHHRLRDKAYAEWRHEYVDYGRLKRLLRKQQHSSAAASPSTASTSSTALVLDIDTDTSSVDKQPQKWRNRKHVGSSTLAEMEALLSTPPAFEDALDAEFDKVERAFARHATHFGDQLALLRSQYRPNAPLATQESLKNSLVELHRMVNLLSDFALLNYTGFIKILKQHDKLSPTSTATLHRKYSAQLDRLAIADAKQCNDLLREIEQLFADNFCDGNRSVALATLVTKRERVVNWSHMYSGIKAGSCLLLLVWLLWCAFVVPTFRSARERHIVHLSLTRAYPVYRGIGGVLLLHWLVGVSFYVWRRMQINYRSIFELTSRRALSHTAVFNDAMNMTLVFFVNILLYYKVVNGDFPEGFLHRGYYPLALFVYAIYHYIVRRWRAQWALARAILQTIASPFFVVPFFHTFVGDYMTSTVKVTQDIAWSVCFFASTEFLELDAVPPDGSNVTAQSATAQTSKCQKNFYYASVVVPLLSSLPLWWRFLQCLRLTYEAKAWWPNLANAFKYALAQVVALFTVFHPFYGGDADGSGQLDATQVTYMVLFTVSSLYMWIWDVTMDWGHGRPEFKFLGDRQLLSRTWIYYLAIVADLFLRFGWTFSIVPPPEALHMMPLYLQPFTMVAELIRRTFWGIFRLENQHLHNTQGTDRKRNTQDVGSNDEDNNDDSSSNSNSCDDSDSDSEPDKPHEFRLKIALVLFVVLALSVAAIAVDK